MDDIVYIKMDGPGYSFAESRGPDSPRGSKPACSALHSHAELSQPRPVRRNCGWPERPRILSLRDTGSVVADSDTRWRARIDIKLYLKPRPVALRTFQLAAVLHEALDGII